MSYPGISQTTPKSLKTSPADSARRHHGRPRTVNPSRSYETPPSLVDAMQLTKTILGWVSGVLPLSFVPVLTAKE
jgi:hypothetical protein